MPLGVECPSCQHRFAVPDKMSGRGVRCPRCEHPFSAITSGLPPSATGLLVPAPVTAVQPAPEADATPAESAAPVSAPSAEPVSANGGAAAAQPTRVGTPVRHARPVRRLTRLVMDLPASVVSKMPGQPEGVAGLALIALLIGLAAWGLTALTSLEFVGLIVAGLGLLLGAVAVAALVSRQQKGLGLPVAATLVNLQATAFAALAAFAPDATNPRGQPGAGEPKNAITELREAMKKQDQNARLAAAVAVGQLAQDLTVTVRELASLLRDNQPPVRAAAAEALGHIGPAARLAYPALEEAFQGDAQETVRKNANIAMKKIGPPTANDLVSALEQLGKDKDGGARAAAAQVIRLIRPDLRLVEPALRDALEDKDAGVRVSAAQALYALDRQAEGVLEELMAGLKDTDAHVRARAALALAGMRADAQKAVEPLAVALQDPDAEVRFKAAFALSAIGRAAKSKLPQLAGALKDSDTKVRLYAARALWEIDPRPAEAGPVVETFAKALDHNEGDMRFTAVVGLEMIARALRSESDPPPALIGAVPALAARLKDNDADVRSRSARALAYIGPAAVLAVPELTKALEHADANLRSHAAFALMHIGEGAKKAALPALGKALEDKKNAEVRLFAAQALWKLEGNSERVLPVLQKLMAEKDGELRARTARALGTLGKKAEPAVVVLHEALKDARNPTLQAQAAEALGKIGASGSSGGSAARVTYPTLLELSKSEEAKVRKAAAKALKDIGRPTQADVSALKRALEEENSAYKAAAVVALWMLHKHAQPAAGALARCLDDPDETVRRTAPFALAAIGPGASEAVPALAKALLTRKDDELLCARAAFALGEIGPAAKEEAAEALNKALADDRPMVKVSAAQALWEVARQTGGVVEALSKVVADQSQEAALRVGAAETLGKIGTTPPADVPALRPLRTDAVEALKKAVADQDESVRVAATAALGALGALARDAVMELMHALEDPEAEVRTAAADALGKIAQSEAKTEKGIRAKVAYAALLFHSKVEQNEQVRKSANLALGRLGAPQGSDAPELIAVLEDQKQEVPFRSAAAQALGLIEKGVQPQVKRMAAVLKDDKAPVRAAVAYALGDLRHEAQGAVEDLIARYAEDKDAGVRAAVVYALGEIGPWARARVLPVLRQAQNDPDEAVRLAAAEARAKLKDVEK